MLNLLQKVKQKDAQSLNLYKQVLIVYDTVELLANELLAKLSRLENF